MPVGQVLKNRGTKYLVLFFLTPSTVYCKALD